MKIHKLLLLWSMVTANNYLIIITSKIKTMHPNFRCQCLSANSWAYLLDVAVIISALLQIMAMMAYFHCFVLGGKSVFKNNGMLQAHVC